MDINAQIKILETLLKQEQNRECADCNSKTPRWASITFGTFVCLRCSGMHRQLQVHITKIKSVNSLVFNSTRLNLIRLQSIW